MNGTLSLKQKFMQVLTGLSVETKGLVTNHNETITDQGAQQIWNALKLADLKVEEVGS